MPKDLYNSTFESYVSLFGLLYCPFDICDGSAGESREDYHEIHAKYTLGTDTGKEEEHCPRGFELMMAGRRADYRRIWKDPDLDT